MTSRYLNLAWLLPAMLITSCSESKPPLYVDVTELSGLSFTHRTRGVDLELPPILGSGVALFDMDNDGDLDVFLVQGSGEPSVPHELWRNDSQETELRFSRVESVAAFDASTPGVGVAVEDVNLDGRLDLFVSGVGVDRLLLNTAEGFALSNALNNESDWSSSVSFVDINVDGLPDVFVTRVGTFDPSVACRSMTQQVDYCGANAFDPLPDRLWMNRGATESGDVEFDDVSDKYGLGNVAAPSLSARVADFDADGWPDIYVAAYESNNLLWMNQRGERLQEQALRLGGASSFVPEFRGSIGVDAADIDRDGDLDVVVSHRRGEPHQLYRNDGDGGFLASSLGPSTMTEADSGAGIAVLDANADAYADVYVANGAVRRRQDQVDASDDLPLRQSNNLMVQNAIRAQETAADLAVDDNSTRANRADVKEKPSSQLFFERWVDEGERLTPRTRVSRAVAVGDLDNDGDLDLVVTNNGASAEVLQNTTNPQEWLGIVPVSATTGLPVLGARVTLEWRIPEPAVEDPGTDPADPVSSELDGALKAEQTYGVRDVRRAHGYLTSSDPRLLFYGPFAAALNAVVNWPDGESETYSVPVTAEYHLLVQGTGQAQVSQ